LASTYQTLGYYHIETHYTLGLDLLLYPNTPKHAIGSGSQA